MIKTLSASDLLKLSVEIITYFPEGTDFDERKLKTPYQGYRHKEALALIKAFGIIEDFSGFVSGSFTASRPEGVYAEALLETRKVLKKYPPDVVSKRKLGLIFELSFGYLVAIERLQRYWKKYIIADPAMLFPQFACKGVNPSISKKSRDFKKILCLIIDPVKMEIPITELIEKYGYPENEIVESNDNI